MSNNNSNNRIAKNTLFLYVRTFLSLLVTLYTSRVVLKVLGADDFGIFGIVGGIVSMFSFLNTAMSGATSRFLTYDMGANGEKNSKSLNRIFSSAFFVHVFIAILIIVVSETFGLWFLHNKLVIPAERMGAANWVFQCSVVSSALTIIGVPYNASIIAHEKMSIFAFVELLNVFLKLGIVFLLQIFNADKLVLYAILSVSVSIIVFEVYRIYCLRQFDECHLSIVFDSIILKSLFSFSGWNLFGNMCNTFNQQANGFLINIFFGVSLNAASVITANVFGAMVGFSSNVILAFRPQIVKSYAKGNIKYMQELIQNGARYAVILSGFILVPLLLELSFVLDLWLEDVPSYTSTFCSIMVWTVPLLMMNNTILFAIHATGNIKYNSIINGCIMLISIPVAYAVLKYGGSEYSTYIVTVSASFLTFMSNIIVFKYLVSEFSINRYLFGICPALLAIFIAAIPSYFIHHFVYECIGRLLLIIFVNALILAVLSYCFLIDNNLRSEINNRIRLLFKH